MKFSGFTKIYQIGQNYSRMPLTNAHITSFFGGADNMAIWHNTVVKFQEEGIEDVDGL